MLFINIMDENKYLLNVKTVQSSAFRVLVEALKEILTDANFEFDCNGIKVMAWIHHTVLVHLKLNAKNFEFFQLNREKITIGVNMINLFKLIKPVIMNIIIIY